jgi:hypothetical protein
MEHYYYIVFFTIIICIILFLLYTYITKNITSTLTAKILPELDTLDKLTYYRCEGKPLNDATLQGLETMQFRKGDTAESSDLYIPCGYNYVEIELAKLAPSAKNKYIYAIKGCDLLCGKNSLWLLLTQSIDTDKASTIIPRTWIIKNGDDMQSLDIYYKNHGISKPAFILKKNIQGKQGLKIADSMEDINNIMTNDNAYKVVQLYIKNCYTINNRKLNIRLYVVITCYNGTVEWYLYTRGKCIYTNKKYDPVHSFVGDNIHDKEQHFTSYNLNTDKVYNEEKLPESLDELQRHMPGFNHIWTSICNKLAIIKDAFNGKLCNLDSLANQVCFQLFGFDVIIDKDTMEPYILEFNKGPEMIYKSPRDKELKPMLMTDMLSMVTNKKGITDSNFIVIDSLVTH